MGGGNPAVDSSTFEDKWEALVIILMNYNHKSTISMKFTHKIERQERKETKWWTKKFGS